MKSKIFQSLKLILPLFFGAFIIWAFYDAMCEEQRKDMFKAFGNANYFWIFLSLIFGFLSHLSRAWRWRYLLRPLGKDPDLWLSYHAVMTGYLVNYIFPRAGEASRAAIMSRRSGLPFNKVFGTIIAERALDLVMLGLIFMITVLTQWEQAGIIKDQLYSFKTAEGCGNSPVLYWLGKAIVLLIIAGTVAALGLTVFSGVFRERIKNLISDIWEGGTSIFKSCDKLPFIGHTLFIWIMYIIFFGICFPAIDTTADLGIDAVLAGFIAGTIGIVVVQGGIGVYPALVGLVLTSYVDMNYDLGIHPKALAMGWLIWVSQTLMMIILGLISVILVARKSDLTIEHAPTHTEENNQ